MGSEPRGDEDDARGEPLAWVGKVVSALEPVREGVATRSRSFSIDVGDEEEETADAHEGSECRAT